MSNLFKHIKYIFSAERALPASSYNLASDVERHAYALNKLGARQHAAPSVIFKTR